MFVENNKKENKYLESLGFNKIYSDDKSCFWFQKNINTKFFDECQIYIEDYIDNAIITVSTYDKETQYKQNHVDIIKKNYSRKTLCKIIELLNQN